MLESCVKSDVENFEVTIFTKDKWQYGLFLQNQFGYLFIYLWFI
jgi:hypothetical protein